MLFIRVYLKTSKVVGNDPIPFSDSPHTPVPDPIYGSGLINVNHIVEVFPFDGDFTSDRCLIHTDNEPDGFAGYISDDFQKLVNHFYMEF